MTIVKTRIKQHPLDDETLETPEHDEMVLWLLNKDNICKLFPEINKLFEESGTLHISSESDFSKLVGNVISSEDYKKYNLWHLIQSNQPMPQQFIDNCITKSEKEEKKISQDELKTAWTTLCTQYLSILDKYKNDIQSRKINISSEVPIISGNNNYVIGFWDVVISINSLQESYCKYARNPYGNYEKVKGITFKPDNTQGINYYIEVKPKIVSFGKTLRQINLYENYVHCGYCEIFLVTKDTRFKEAFESQNIIVKTLPLPEEQPTTKKI